ncbi:hypothetical protein ABIC09_007350 [Bradyrhizobium sp. S3.12.5]
MALVVDLDRAHANLIGEPRQRNQGCFLVAIATSKKPLHFSRGFATEHVGIRTIQRRAVVDAMVKMQHGSNSWDADLGIAPLPWERIASIPAMSRLSLIRRNGRPLSMTTVMGSGGGCLHVQDPSESVIGISYLVSRSTPRFMHERQPVQQFNDIRTEGPRIAIAIFQSVGGRTDEVVQGKQALHLARQTRG